MVHCGPWVELRSNWFCEAAWDGQFDQGDFDRTDIVAGSGGKLVAYRWNGEKQLSNDNFIFVTRDAC